MKKSSVVLASLFAIWIIISLVQLWANFPEFVIYSKVSFSFLLIGGSIFFSSLITNEHLVGDLRIASIVAIGSITLWAVLSLIQLWVDIIDESLYIKLTITKDGVSWNTPMNDLQASDQTAELTVGMPVSYTHLRAHET